MKYLSSFLIGILFVLTAVQFFEIAKLKESRTAMMEVLICQETGGECLTKVE